MRIHLLFFPSCPHVLAARRALRHALATAGLPIEFEEVDVTDAATPEPLRRWGSPTILVGGVDVADGMPSGMSCRLYPESEHPGAPSPDLNRVCPARSPLTRARALFTWIQITSPSGSRPARLR